MVERNVPEEIAETGIRKAAEHDAAAISAILRELGWFEYLSAETTQETEQRVRRHIALFNADDSHSLYVAESSGGEVVGYAAIHWLPYLFLKGPEGYLSELFVRESERGKGIGTRLMEVIKAEARVHGCSRLMLVNSRSRESYRRGFYKELGWEEREGVANFVQRL